jgi:hypothetical protein
MEARRLLLGEGTFSEELESLTRKEKLEETNRS